MTDDAGSTYYENKTRGMSQWDKPQDLELLERIVEEKYNWTEDEKKAKIVGSEARNGVVTDNDDEDDADRADKPLSPPPSESSIR